MGRGPRLAICHLVCWTLFVDAPAAQPRQSNDAQTSSPQTRSDTENPPQVQEIGGRLVTSGETVEVEGSIDESPRNSSVATKIDTPLIATPRSVTIVDRQTLDDVSAINITQAHDYTVGMTPQDERGPAYARGFLVDFYDLRRDGLRTYSWSVREPVALDRIQYLRGAASVLYGDGSPGGLINLLLKKPMPVRRIEVGGSAGSLGFGRFTADATGPLNTDRTVRYRLIAAGEWLGNGYDNNERRLTFLPAVSVDLSANATLSADTEIYTQRGRNYRHAVPATPEAQQGDFSQIPWDLSIVSPDDGWTGSNVAPGVRLDVDLGRSSSLHVAGRYTRIEGDLDLQPLVGPASGDSDLLTRYHYREISAWDEYQSDAFATTAGRIGTLEHRFVMGIEAGFSATDSQIGFGSADPLNMRTRVYTPPPSAPTLVATRFDITRLGLYATDQMRFSNAVTVVPGLRWSRLAIDDKVAASAGNSRESDSSDHLLSPSIGVVVLPRPWFSLYSTYTQGFEPPTPGQYLEDGSAPDLSSSRTFEAGAKADLADQRLSLTGAGFRIRRTNIPEADPRGFYRQIGEGESHGLELELVGMVAPGLTARAGYAWTSTEITQDAVGTEGRDLPNTPRHKANLWMRYRFGTGTLRGLMVAAGVVHVSERFTARDNVVVAPAYTRVDASASWDVAGPRLTLGGVVTNVADVRYVTSGAGAVFFAGPARRVAIEMRTAF